MDFELPEDITALDDEQLSDALAGAIAAFDAGSRAETITPKGLEALRALSDGVKVSRHEQAAAEIDALAASVRDDSPDDITDATAVEETAAAEPDAPWTAPNTAPLE
ncbi:hypothetical protein ACIQEY_34615 [Streptomyces parvus]|uniref:hypothetical protein n=1 Tax=Streptomyces parvus TaxID=66428 RepID=UPI00380DBA42